MSPFSFVPLRNEPLVKFQLQYFGSSPVFKGLTSIYVEQSRLRERSLSYYVQERQSNNHYATHDATPPRETQRQPHDAHPPTHTHQTRIITATVYTHRPAPPPASLPPALLLGPILIQPAPATAAAGAGRAAEVQPPGLEAEAEHEDHPARWAQPYGDG
ncbi:hypothetical protein BP5796_08970 [Coleophoma crateriformis]|uniref:Uncharacterized protein n=1 Tax=Coleophoma crateriformis TaxID=565419 RepID=A0A3D8R2N4_9HELO|nr:hypothetical protein BP5796_08970 [Coleophoma crateriformis]